MRRKGLRIATIVMLTAVLLLQRMPLPSFCKDAMPAFADETDLVVQVHSNQPAEELLVEVLKSENEAEQMAPRRILIYHTHTYEAYQQDEKDAYAQLEKWRTKDEKHNVIAVGRALCAGLEAIGFEVTHDTTAFEPPTMNDAYARSLTMLEARKQAGEQYDLYIDLHRDAIASSSAIKRTVSVGGTEIARFMVLIGQGTTGGYAEKPDWLTNKRIADQITASLNRQIDGLARDVKVKTGRFNQHVDDCCVLIECGTNWNTLQEVLNGIPYLAQAIKDALAAQ